MKRLETIIKTPDKTKEEKASNQKQKISRLQAANGQCKIRLTTLGPSQSYGESDVVLGRSYTTTITCMENDSQGYLMKRDDFLKLFTNNEAAWNIMFEHI